MQPNKGTSIFNTLKEMEYNLNQKKAKGQVVHLRTRNGTPYSMYTHSMLNLTRNNNNNNKNNNNTNLNTLNNYANNYNNAESTTIDNENANARSIHSLSSLNLMNYTGVNNNQKPKPNRKSFLKRIFGRTKKSNRIPTQSSQLVKKRSFVNKLKNFMTPKNDPNKNWNAYYGFKKGGKRSKHSTRRRRSYAHRQN